MAINQNHLFEDLDGVKCAIVEKNVSEARVAFLKDLLEANNFTVVVVKSPPPKAAAKPAAAALADGATPQPAPEPVPEGPSTYTVGVTDVRFNPTNYLYGRLLRTRDGHVVTVAYWQQKDAVSRDEVPYYAG
ncbi:MAG: hypothetical protein U0X76_04840 [Bacteroidia bacterium]